MIETIMLIVVIFVLSGVFWYSFFFTAFLYGRIIEKFL